MTDTGDQASFTELINGTLEFTIPAAHRMGVQILEAGPGRAAASVPLEGNGNHFGAMYAGVLFTVAEILGGVVSLATFDSSAYYPLVKDLRITFARAARTDVRAQTSLGGEEIARIMDEAAAKGKADFTLAAEIVDADGQIVATTRGLYQLRAHVR